MSLPSQRRSISVLLAVGLAAACTDAPPATPAPAPGAAAARRPPDVILISIDTLRADRLGVYGYDRPTSPAIDAFARDAVVFERHLAQSPLTLPSHASILTGRDPDRHGVRSNGSYRLTEDAVTLTELLAAAGFTTAAVVSSSVLDPVFGLDQGFAMYAGDFTGTSGNVKTPANETTDRAIAWLRHRSRDERLFLFVHYYDPHKPYQAAARAGLEHPYDAEVAFVDAQLGRLLARLAEDGRLDDALVVITSDHGQSLGEHGVDGHTLVLFQQTLHVPLIVRLPGGAHGGRRVTSLTRSTDLVPTVLGQLGLPVPPAVDGIDLAPALGGGALPTGRRAYAETLFTEVRPLHQHAVVRGRYKLISWYELDPGDRLDALIERLGAAAEARPALKARLARVLDRVDRMTREPRQLYDLEADPAEQRNLYRERPQIAGELEALLAARRAAEAAPPTAERFAPSPELLERLGTLGYLAFPPR